MASKSSSGPARRKPSRKPHPAFPLSRHPTGRWCKKILGKLVYFGRIAKDPDGQQALQFWVDHKDEIIAGLTAGRKPSEIIDRINVETSGGGLTVADLSNHFLTSKKRLQETGEITGKTFSEYNRTTDRLVRVFGKGRLVDGLAPDDFEKLRADIAKTWGPIRLGNEIKRVRGVLKYAFETGLIDRPVRHGPAFKPPGRHVLRIDRASKAPRMFEAGNIRAILDVANVHMTAMIMLAVNCGFGNHDCERLPIDAVDLGAGWIDFPRPKTGIPRRVPLWTETTEALKASLASRPAPKTEDCAGLFFITKYGQSWHDEKTSGPISLQFRRLLDSLKLHKPGKGFYSLRHVFETIGGDSRDQVAVDAIMGHVRDDMASVYRERVSDERLRAVVDHVHDWLFATVDDQADDHQQPPAADDRPRLRIVS